MLYYWSSKSITNYGKHHRMAKNIKKSYFQKTVRKFDVFEFWRLGWHPVVIRPLECNLELPEVTRFHLVPHLPWLVGLERRTTTLHRQTKTMLIYIQIFVVIYFTALYFSGHVACLSSCSPSNPLFMSIKFPDFHKTATKFN